VKHWTSWKRAPQGRLYESRSRLLNSCPWPQSCVLQDYRRYFLRWRRRGDGHPHQHTGRIIGVYIVHAISKRNLEIVFTAVLLVVSACIASAMT
jgi:hypothetical protein